MQLLLSTRTLIRKLLLLPKYIVSMRVLSARPFFKSNNAIVKPLSIEDITGYY
jgi:hypothetical protein